MIFRINPSSTLIRGSSFKKLACIVNNMKLSPNCDMYLYVNNMKLSPNFNCMSL